MYFNKLEFTAILKRDRIPDKLKFAEAWSNEGLEEEENKLHRKQFLYKVLKDNGGTIWKEIKA